MKIENETLYINKTDLDHILGYLDAELLDLCKSTPPSDLFLEGLEVELQLNGLEDEIFKNIVIENIKGI